MGKEEEEADKRSVVQCLRSRWKQLLVAVFLLAAVALLIVDFASNACTLVEKEEDRKLRLFCEGALLLTENNTLLVGQPFICSNASSTSEPEFTVGPSGNTCEKSGLCSELAIGIFLDWFKDNAELGFFATALVYAIATLLLIPGSVLTISAGAAFGAAFGLGLGTLLGTVSVWLGASAGATVAFILGRYLLREYSESLTNRFKSFRAIDHVLGTKGLQIMLLLRLSPVVPFTFFNYLVGATACSLRNYVLGTVIGIIPGSAVYVFVGASISAVAMSAMGIELDGTAVFTPSACEEPDNTATIVIIVLGVIATIIALIVIVRYARKQYLKILEEEKQREEREDGVKVVPAPTL